IQDQLVVTPGRGVVDRIVAVVVTDVHVRAELFHQIAHGRNPSVRDAPVDVGGEAFAVAHSGSRMDGEDARTAVRHGGQTRWIRDLPLYPALPAKIGRAHV